MASPSALRVARTDEGCCVRVEGRGTMKESPAVQEFVTRTLTAAAAATPDAARPAAAVTIDLSACDYLDSTFLGCLLGLHKQFGKKAAGQAAGKGDAPPFAVAAPPDRVAKLFGPTRLDRLIHPRSELPCAAGEWVPLDIPPPASDKRDLAQHVLECHRRLAEVEGPQQAAFIRIAEQLEREVASA